MSLRHIKNLTLKNFSTDARRSLIDEISLVGPTEFEDWVGCYVTEKGVYVDGSQ